MNLVPPPPGSLSARGFHTPDVTADRKLLGRFDLQAELGRGSLGVVYRATVKRLGLPVALRVVQDTVPAGTIRARLHQLAPVIQSFNHPGVARIFDLYSDDDRIVIVMEYVEGRSLRSWLDERGRLPAAVALKLFDQALAAVGAAHDHDLLHRDIRPEKFLISTSGRLKLTDLGYAGLLQEWTQRDLTELGASRLAGVAPERIRAEAFDARADIYSLGVTLYELVAGEPPFVGSTLSVLRRHLDSEPPAHPLIPAEVMDVLRYALAKEPARRPRSCSEFAGLLATAATALPTNGTRSPVEWPAGLDGWPSGTRTNCLHTGCGAPAVVACEYEDAAGRVCGSAWCDRHVTLLPGGAFCRRHAVVVRDLERHGEPWLLRPRPSVQDRAMALATVVGEELDEAMREILRRHYDGASGVAVIGEGTLRRVGSETEAAWERTWGVVRSDRWLHRVELRVPCATPDQVEVLVNGAVVFTGIPDWIARRIRREGSDPADRSQFRERVLATVQAVVDRSPLLSRIPLNSEAMHRSTGPVLTPHGPGIR
jgi:hypothetical protein